MGGTIPSHLSSLLSVFSIGILLTSGRRKSKDAAKDMKRMEEKKKKRGNLQVKQQKGIYI